MIFKQHIYVVVIFIICYTIFKKHIYVGNIFIICYTIFVQLMYGICSPWPMFFKKSHNMVICFLQYALTHVIAPRYPTWQCTIGFHDWVSCLQTWSCFDCVITAWRAWLTVTINPQSWQLGIPAWQAVLMLLQPTQRDTICVQQLFTQ